MDPLEIGTPPIGLVIITMHHLDGFTILNWAGCIPSKIQLEISGCMKRISDGFGLVLLTSKSIHLRNLIYIHQAKEIGYSSAMLTEKRISTIIL